MDNITKNGRIFKKMGEFPKKWENIQKNGRIFKKYLKMWIELGLQPKVQGI